MGTTHLASLLELTAEPNLLNRRRCLRFCNKTTKEQSNKIQQDVHQSHYPPLCNYSVLVLWSRLAGNGMSSPRRCSKLAAAVVILCQISAFHTPSAAQSQTLIAKNEESGIKNKITKSFCSEIVYFLSG